MQLALKAIFDSYRTTKDGGAKITFEVDESNTDAAIQVQRLKDKVLYLVVMDESQTLQVNSDVSEG